MSNRTAILLFTLTLVLQWFFCICTLQIPQQNRLQWYVHVLRKEDTDWVKKCMDYEADGSRPRGRPKRTWKEVVQKDCQARNLNKEDAMDRGRWKKLIDWMMIRMAGR